MTGGLLNLVSEGNQNVFLTGNPCKTFFKAVYKKYTNFGLQRLRIDYDGQRYLSMEQETLFSFKVPRYAELLMDTYLVITLPDIWSPIYNIKKISTDQENMPSKYSGVPYEFKWIENIGTQMIKEISINAGGQTLQKMSGSYLSALKERDFSGNKKNLYDKMTGHIPEFYEPENSGNNCNKYPNALFWGNDPAEPSIRGRKLYIPINAWFSLNSKMAFPLISMQYNELTIDIRMRPVNELFTIRDVKDNTNNYPRIKPNFNDGTYAFYRFIQSPSMSVNSDGENVENNYQDKNVEWETDVHLMGTYVFLSDDESKQFAAHEQKYLIKEVHEYTFQNITGSKKIRLDSLGMVASWMFQFQRSDIALRNEWSNLTNWEFKSKPYEIIKQLNSINSNDELVFFPQPTIYNESIIESEQINLLNDPVNTFIDNPINFRNIKPNCGCECNSFQQTLYNTGPFRLQNNGGILIDLAILFDGQYREDTLDSGVFNYIDKYIRTKGNAKNGLYCYNFCLSTDPFDTQPSGAINMSRFEKIELEVNTYEPPKNNNAPYSVICNDDGEPIGINKSSSDVFEYNYDLTVFEERINIVHFISGNCALAFAR